MAISGLGAYNNVLFQWQNQQLKSTGSSSGSSASSSLASNLLGNNASMTSQISSLVELTKYAMDAMGVSSDSRVTFSQITKYREQLQNEFSTALKDAIANSGLSDPGSLTYSLDKNGKIVVSGGSAADRKLAQGWYDSNASYGQELLESLTKAGVDIDDEIQFTLSSTGKMTVVDNTAKSMQATLDANEGLTENLRKGLEEAGIEVSWPLEFEFDEDGSLTVAGNQQHSKAIHNWLAENTELEDEVKQMLLKNKTDERSVALRLAQSGAIQIRVNNARNNEAQAVFDKSGIGAKLSLGLSNLGIDKDIKFSLQMNADGTMSVVSDHPDKDKITQLFKDNPELLKKYQQIEALAGIDDARKAMQISPSAMRKRIQIESMAAWWDTSGNANSYFGNYGNSNFSLLSGLNMSV